MCQRICAREINFDLSGTILYDEEGVEYAEVQKTTKLMLVNQER